MSLNQNVERKEGFVQVVVWHGTILEESEHSEFEEWVMSTFGVRAQFLESVTTTGGRVDVLFAIHSNDIAKFAVPRFTYGMRWLEDVYGNGTGGEYPERIAGYMCWDKNEVD